MPCLISRHPCNHPAIKAERASDWETAFSLMHGDQASQSRHQTPHLLTSSSGSGKSSSYASIEVLLCGFSPACYPVVVNVAWPETNWAPLLASLGGNHSESFLSRLEAEQWLLGDGLFGLMRCV
jgi:hypothetical protein